MPLGRRIADGGYDWTNPDITPERFSITLNAGPADLFLAHFGDDIEMESEEVEAWAEANSYEVAYIEEELAVGAHHEHGKLQLQFPIVALGSSAVVDGRARVPYLSGSDAERYLGLDYRDGAWRGRYRFLLRKKPLAPGAIGSG